MSFCPARGAKPENDWKRKLPPDMAYPAIIGEKLKGRSLKGSFDKACMLTCRFLFKKSLPKIFSGAIATISRNQLRKRILWELLLGSYVDFV